MPWGGVLTNMIMAHDRPYILSVLSGPNTGACVALASGLSTIGREPTETVVLDDLQTGAVSIALSGDRLRVRAETGGVSIRGKGPLTTQTKATTALPAVLELDEDTLVSIQRVSSLRRRRKIPTLSLVPVALIAGGLGMDLSGPGDISGWMTTEIGALWTEIATPPPKIPLAAAQPAVAHKPKCDVTCQTEQLQTFQNILRDNGFNSLHVNLEANVLRVSGYVAHGETSKWSQLRRRVEADWGTGISIIAQISEQPAPPALRVSSVWLGPTPIMRTQNGETLRIGDTTLDGWRITGIQEKAVELTKGTFDFSLMY